jgi:hypothetical protein
MKLIAMQVTATVACSGSANWLSVKDSPEGGSALHRKQWPKIPGMRFVNTAGAAQVGGRVGHVAVRRLSKNPSAKKARDELPKTANAQPAIFWGVLHTKISAKQPGVVANRASKISVAASIFIQYRAPKWIFEQGHPKSQARIFRQLEGSL